MANNTEVIFEDIEQRIIREIKDAHYAIFVSVAWFTNKKLFNALLEKAKSNCYVSIIIQLDEINSQSGIDYSQIEIGRSECFKISKDAELLHDKFCVIDFKKVITGSYNWTYKAAHNSENILILDDPTVATQYISRFEQQKSKYKGRCTLLSLSDSTMSNNNSINVQEVNTTIPPQPKRCNSCGCKLGIDDIFCPHCGAQQKACKIENSIICSKCSHKQVPPILSRGTKFCTNCGNLIREHELSPNKCPICKNDIDRSLGRNFCTHCGLSDSIYKKPSDDSKRIILSHVRPEFKTFEQFQLCHKCNAINVWGANYCRSCGENISTHAKDKNEHEWVDLGLSVLWSPNSIGFYCWMDTERIAHYMYLGNKKRTNKDAASELLGNKWRMPTKQEVEELVEKCEWETIIEHNYLFLKITGPNQNHILLYLDKDSSGDYEFGFWTSTKDEDNKIFSFYFLIFEKVDKQIIGERKKRRSIKKHTLGDVLRIIPVADKKWQGKL